MFINSNNEAIEVIMNKMKIGLTALAALVSVSAQAVDISGGSS